MKKLIALSILMVALVALGAVSVSAADDPIASYGTPVFDGIMDDMYLASTELIADDRVTLDCSNDDADPGLAQFVATASFRFMWDEEYLYCYFETKDNTPSDTYSGWFEGADAVRIYVDYYPDKEDGYDFRDEPHGFNAFITPKCENVMNYQVTGKQLCSDGAGLWLENMISFAVKFDKNYVGPTDGSIAGEFRIKWDESMDPTAGYVLDILLAALDDVDGEDGIEYYNWYGETENVDLESARKYCGDWNPLVLSDVTYVPPVVVAQGTPTMDGKMDDLYLAAEEVVIDDRFVSWESDMEEDAAADLVNFLATGSIRFLWDENFLYCYFETKDNTPSGTYSDWFEGSDAVRLYVDYDPNGAMGIDYRDEEVGATRAFNVFLTPKCSAVMNYQAFGAQLKSDGAGLWLEASPTAVVKFDKNYVGETAGSIAGEFRIPWADNMDPEVGHVLGFLAAVLDDINNDEGIEYATFYGEHRDMDLEPARKKTGPWDKMILTDVTYVAPEEPTETLDAGLVVAVSVMAIAAGVVLTKKK